MCQRLPDHVQTKRDAAQLASDFDGNAPRKAGTPSNVATYWSTCMHELVVKRV